MNILINNETKAINQESTVEQMLQAIALESDRGIAVAINNEVIPKSNWGSQALKENDKVTIIRATQGG